MVKSLEPSSSKESSKELKKPRGRRGGRSPLPEEEKAEEIHASLPKWLLEAFKRLVPRGIDRSKLIIGWVRAYVVANGESDRLLLQSPLTAELLAYLEATDAPEELRDKLESLIVARDSDEVKIAESAGRG